MCKTGNELQRAWYAVSIIVNGDIDEGEASKAVEANRGLPEYRMAKAAFVEHVQSCDECKNWRMK